MGIIFRLTLAIRQNVLNRINDDENLEAVSPRRFQGRGCSPGLDLHGENGCVYFCIAIECRTNRSI